MEPVQEKKDTSNLNKKEKRALKVREKQQQQQQPAEKVLNKEQQLTEKQKRKLEWEKKLAEQKLQQQQQQNNEKQEVSKAELRQKRREQQEAQRLAKANAQNEQQKQQQQQQKREEETKQSNDKKNTTILKESHNKKVTNQKLLTIKTRPATTTTTNKIQLVNHLYLENLQRIDGYKNSLINYKNVHPVFIRLGNQYLTKTILGSNARCLALLHAIKILIKDIEIPPKQEFVHYFDLILQSCIKYLQYCRPFAVTMTNALRYFKGKLRESIKLYNNNTSNNNDVRSFLINSIDIYINDEIDKASEAISLKVQEKISNGDIILTYGCSSLIRRILLEAHKSANKQFHVIVVDGRPLLEGRQLLQRLVNDGIKCSYIQINAVNYVMNKVTKVLLGCHALLTNGYVMSRIGTAQVALIAQAYNKPVLVTCETYKFSERVQTDSFVYNEIGDNSLLNSIDTLDNDHLSFTTVKNDDKLNILNLLYDVTPPNLVTAVVTELAILPCTSVPVVLRIKPTDFV